ncbi:phosphoribosylanthranilate isomerase [Luteolibacter sp. GHJ8]|uniref:N-(5'-phosphoribosyl)anthranilate isomerase n=1 Tax=Luteolibacter rhizosphaerae TaxID=2989719 RepID=A0ABT3G395_9BACT|nr:phosphoribosylanthranilate isomerase [Luteolibacter rhizosphaerae]MCW1914318.1 phosphoribosylanthranilate isomerase [Luteolibacter rhizosphaerae]
MTAERFLAPSPVSLKICGVTLADDAERLVAMGIDALGANFWPHSKRYLDPAAAGFLRELQGCILRVGVFVNAGPDLPRRLVEEGLIDLVQLHGDETPEEAAVLREAGIPFLKAIGVKGLADLERARDFGAAGILLDAHAPGIYGGTGQTIDWELARSFAAQNPDLPLILAGGIVPANVSEAVQAVSPVALDVASGAEISPGVKDFRKVAALQAGTRGATISDP